MSCTECGRRTRTALALAFASAATIAAAGAPPPQVDVVTPLILPLAGPVAAPDAEVSGLAWHGETLVLVPEEPDRFAPGDTLGLFVLEGEEIRAALAAGDGRFLTPRLLPCVAPGLIQLIGGFDGLEALALVGDRVFLAVEAKQPGAMAGYLVGGRYDLAGGVIHVDAARRTPIPLGVDIFNVAVEALVGDGERVIAIVEANGRNLRPQPLAPAFALDLSPLPPLPFPMIEYRVTDATAPDAEGRFWVINYFFPPDEAKLDPAADPEVARYGAPSWLTPHGGFERLLELQLTADDRIVRTDTPPLWLAPRPDGRLRNWEGIVRCGQGFLLVTDEHPATLLAYVPRPGTD